MYLIHKCKTRKKQTLLIKMRERTTEYPMIQVLIREEGGSSYLTTSHLGNVGS